MLLVMSRKEVCSYIEMNRGMNIIGSFNRMMTNVSFKAQSMVESVFCGLKSKFKSRMMRCCVVMGLGMSMALPAEAAISLTSDASTVCPGSALVLTASGTTTGAWLNYFVSTDGGLTWTAISTTKATTCVDDMPSVTGTVEYKVVDGNNNESATVTVTAATSNCSKECHQTSTGDFYSGTDFNPKDTNAAPSTWTVPNGVESYFSNDGVTLSPAATGKYKVTNNIGSFFNSTNPVIPSLDKNSTSNYYMALTDNSMSPWTEITIPNNAPGKHYRYNMRFYLYPDKDASGNCACSQWSGDEHFIVRTGIGTTTTDIMQISAYDDATGALINSISVTNNGTPSIRLKELIPDFVNNKGCGKLYRFEFTFYGTFPTTMSGSELQYKSVNYNFTLESGGCPNTSKVAIDYISSEVQSVCLTHGAVCVGSNTTVNAAGFAKNAHYTWESSVDGVTWTSVADGTDEKSLSIDVKWLGTKKFRVYDANEPSIIIPFTITGKDCAPAKLESVTGPATVCAPASTTAYTLTPVDANIQVSYDWKLTNSAGDDVTKQVTINYVDTRHSGVSSIEFPETLPTGTYTLSVQLVKETANVGDPVTTNILVVTKPSTVDFTANPSPVCVNASPVVLTNNSTSGTYYYTWTATKGTLETTAANTTTRDNSLALTKTELCDNTSFDVTLKAASDAAGTCYKEVTKTISVKNETPAITCPTTAKTNVTLLATESAATYTLEKPTITGMDCTTDPTVTVTFSGTALDGTNLSTLGPVVKKVSELPATVSIPATAGASGTTGGNNGVTIKYSVTNYCGTKTVDCSYTVIVRDVSAPNIKCSGITNYNNVKLSNYTGCQAIPGGGTDPAMLPALTAPVLEDQDHPGTNITGTFVQSVTNGVKSTVLPTAIDTGETVITWKFTDLAGNSTTCTQTIDVYDDKVPTVTCPAITDLGEITIDHALCYVTHDNLIKQIKAALGTNLPTATDACHGNLVLKDTLVCKQTGSPEWQPVGDGTHLFKGHYDLEWRFYKQGGSYTDKTVFAKCDETFVVEDKQAAVLDCNVNKTWTVVSVNTTTDAQGKEMAQTYASAAQPTDSTTSTLYTLENRFTLPTIDADNHCTGDVETLSITIKKADGTEMERYSKSNYDATMTLLNAYPFKLSESGYTVTYTYTDNSDNAASCVQNVIVLDREKPIPNCWVDTVQRNMLIISVKLLLQTTIHLN
jgi:hypothetical protein